MFEVRVKRLYLCVRVNTEKLAGAFVVKVVQSLCCVNYPLHPDNYSKTLT